MKARHCFLTLILDKPTLNIVLPGKEIICVEISDAHLANLLQDGVKMAFRAGRGGK